MTVAVFGSVKGAPGVTTSVLALAWVWPTVTGRRVLVVDADTAGSGILPGLLHAEPAATGGLLALAATRDTDQVAAILSAATALDGDEDRLLLTGVSDPAQARALDGLWPRLTQACADLDAHGVDVLVDTGRISDRRELGGLWQAATVRVVGVDSRLAGIATARTVLGVDTEQGQPPRLLVIGPDRPYSIAEIRTALRLGGVDALAWDPRAAGVFSDGTPAGWWFTRSPLLRTARILAGRLHGLTFHAPPVVGVGS